MAESIELPSGRILRANRGIFGINHELNVFDGYDGVPVPSVYDVEFHNTPPLNRADRTYLAGYVIDLWEQWASSNHVNSE